MKKMTKLLPLVLIALLSVGFTSCSIDDDPWSDTYEDPWFGDWNRNIWWNNNYANPSEDLLLMARTLRGHWSGTTAARFYDADNILRNEVYNTDIEFDQYKPNALFGRGRQRDYSGKQLVYDRTFTWHIDTKTWDIHMVYDGSNGQAFEMVIDYDDLRLDEHRFQGIQRGRGETDEFDYGRYTYAKKYVFDPE